MVRRGIYNRIREKLSNNRGTTLVEMIVSFALLAIFLLSASMMITSISTMYYNIKGEIYSRQVSDIVMEKIASEIDGAKYFEPVSPGEGEDEEEEAESPNPTVSDDNKSIKLYDKTNTKVSLYRDESAADKGLVVHYDTILYMESGFKNTHKSKEATDWYFDEKMYNGFKIKELKFYNCGEGATLSTGDANAYGLSGVDLSAYGKNVILVLLKTESERYGEYKYFRFVKMYNVPE